MTNKLVVIINSLKVPKIKKTLLYEMKFLVPNYSCLQNPWLGGYRPRSPFSLSSTEFVEPPPPQQNSWVRHWTFMLWQSAGHLHVYVSKNKWLDWPRILCHPTWLPTSSWRNVRKGHSTELLYCNKFVVWPYQLDLMDHTQHTSECHLQHKETGGVNLTFLATDTRWRPGG